MRDQLNGELVGGQLFLNICVGQEKMLWRKLLDFHTARKDLGIQVY